MNSLLIIIGAFVCYIVAYNTYGRFLARKIFKLNPENICPSESLKDDVDYVPTKRGIVFGHHFVSIAGTGPIVGPAIALIWGWLPATLWVIFGSIFVGALHDFGALVISLRNRGLSLGSLIGDLISYRVKLLFMLIIFFTLILVISVFAVVIALCFQLFPSSVWPIWLEIPIAVAVGWIIYKKGGNAKIISITALVIVYLTMIIGIYFPIEMPGIGQLVENATGEMVWRGLSPVAVWVVILLIYAFIASILPVQTLLQPRDYINSHQLIVIMFLLLASIIFTHPQMVAPATVHAPKGAPQILPFLFITVACGAVSGFHSLVSSGTSSKQCATEKDALFIGYGAMLIEGMLAILVIVACGAGIGYGLDMDGTAVFQQYYGDFSKVASMDKQLQAFIDGSANMLRALHLPMIIATTMMGIFIVSFAATTIDSATRIQTYIIKDLGAMLKIPFLNNRYVAALVAVGTAFLLAFSEGSGTGAMRLWPIFGCFNQLIAALALLAITVYLARRKINVLYAAIPMVFMLVITAWGMYYNILQYAGITGQARYGLLVIAIIVMIFEFWMLVESALLLRKLYAQRGSLKPAIDDI